MATKLGRKELPAGFRAEDFKYAGRPANDQGDFGPDVGVADCACVDQFGSTGDGGTANHDKFYSGGVVEARGRWFVYLEWGRAKPGFSWVNGAFTGQDFQFVDCTSESDAREFFAKQMDSKNRKRLVQKDIGGKTIWASKPGEDGYLVQKLATRQRGLPDAYTIKDSTGVQTAPIKVAIQDKAVKPAASSVKTFHPKVLDLASALVGGVKTYARAASQATGIVPTMSAINEVRDSCLPTALTLIGQIGPDVLQQIRDSRLIDLSKYVAALVPRPIPRGGTPEDRALAMILSAQNILSIQQDLDTYESALKSEKFDTVTVGATPNYDPDTLLNAHLTWLDPRNEGSTIIQTLLRMTNNRHSYLSGPMKVLNLFQVDRPDRDARFMSCAETVAAKRKGQFSLRANLQPSIRTDLTDKESKLYQQANVIFTQHGTRSVNIFPIVSGHFRLPKSLVNIPLAGSNFGHGTYFATDYKKSASYTSYERAIWSGGGGGISGRGAFMFLCDTVMGDAYRAPSTGSWAIPPNGCDSVFGVGGDRGHRLENDEHICFNPDYARIRYVVEFTF